MFKKIIYINLDRRPDRNQQIIDEINKIQFDGPIERISGVDGNKISIDIMKENFTENAINEANNNIKGEAGVRMTLGAMGLSLTYKQIFTQILNDKYEYTLILEDDAKFVDNFLEKINDLINNIPEYDILYPGYHNGYGEDEGNYAIVEKVWGTFSFIVNKKAAAEILKLFPLDTQFDTEIHRTFENLRVFATLYDQKLVWTPNDDTDIQTNLENGLEGFINTSLDFSFI